MSQLHFASSKSGYNHLFSLVFSHCYLKYCTYTSQTRFQPIVLRSNLIVIIVSICCKSALWTEHFVYCKQVFVVNKFHGIFTIAQRAKTGKIVHLSKNIKNLFKTIMMLFYTFEKASSNLIAWLILKNTKRPKKTAFKTLKMQHFCLKQQKHYQLCLKWHCKYLSCAGICCPEITKINSNNLFRTF